METALHWSEEAVERIAHRFKMLAEPSRLRILFSLLTGERSCAELIHETGIAQAALSRQLALLSEGGMVARRRAGAQVLYRIVDPALPKITEMTVRSLQHREQQLMRALADES
ncbi:MAG: Biofilm growth-associated repressor [bacterium ADurb.Bin429]|nr:MAG: Biofilm growth-associated repressor [bacterium ADurb.Bin429]